MDDTAWTIEIRRARDQRGKDLPVVAHLTGWTDGPPPAVGSEAGPLTAVDHDGRLWRVPAAVVSEVHDYTFTRAAFAPARVRVCAVVKGEFQGPI